MHGELQQVSLRRRHVLAGRSAAAAPTRTRPSARMMATSYEKAVFGAVPHPHACGRRRHAVPPHPPEWGGTADT
eukprot:2866313-Prymnesium_polylepis.1